MTFQIHALPAEPFAPFFKMPDRELAQHNARLITAPDNTGYPCRVSLAEARKGERLLLVNYSHMPEASPYRATHAIYVREAAAQAYPAPGEVPNILIQRLISVRAFGADHLMRAADVIDGREAASAIDWMLADPDVAYLHLHSAMRGCFLASATRTG